MKLSRFNPKLLEALGSLNKKKPLESLSFYRQQMFDVSTASKDAFQINPATLDINPNIKESHDTIQLVLPAQSIFLKHLQEQMKEKDDDEVRKI